MARRMVRIVFYGFVFFAAAGFCDSASVFETLKADARPWAIYYWVNGLVDDSGIARDVQAAYDGGLGGFLMMDVFCPGIPDNGPAFNSPGWRGLVENAATEIAEKGMSLGMTSAAGWSAMGGPWVPVEDAMKELTWSVTVVQGRQKKVILPQPDAHNGFYRDIAVLAVPGEGAENISDKVIFRSSGTLSENDIEQLRDRSLAGDVAVKPQTQMEVEVPDDLPQPGALRFRMPRLNFDRAGDVSCEIESSADGKAWVPLRSVDLRWNFSAPEVSKNPLRDSVTVVLPSGVGPFLRLTFPLALPLAELEFLTGSHIDYQEAKAALVMSRNMDSGFPEISSTTPKGPDGGVVSSADVLNLTAQMESSGELVWDVPKGTWRIFRFGYTVNGRHKGVTREGGRGWVVDTMSRKAAQRHLDAYMQTLLQKGGPVDGKIQVLHSDSWEEFHQNWTQGFEDQFQKRRGYDLFPFLPALTGDVLIDSVDVSERFFWDFRRTLADLIIENHFGAVRDWAHEHGLVSHADNAGRQQWLKDAVRFQMVPDIPEGEFWLFQDRMRPDIKAAASAAHLSGRNIVSSEAFTDTGRNDGWRTCPSRLKSLADRAFCEGVNMFNFHTYTAQPDRMPPPGVTLGKWGTMYSRNRLWWKDYAPEWHGYMRRCSELLRKGLFCADVLLIVSDGAPSEAGNAEDFPISSGYGFDLGCSELLASAEVEDGELVLPSGMRYRLVVFSGTEQRPSTLQAVERLVNAGVSVLGLRPNRAPGLENYPVCDLQVHQLVERLWPSSGQGMRTIGRGKIFSGLSVQEALERLQIRPQFESRRSELHFIRRNLSEGPVYFVANASGKTVESLCRFRVGAGYAPVLYDPVSDTCRSVPVFEEVDGVVEIRLKFDSLDSVFVLFSKEGSAASSLHITRDGKPFDYYHPVTAQTSCGLLSISVGSDGWQVAQKDNVSYVVIDGSDAPALPVHKMMESSFSKPWKLEFVSPLDDGPSAQSGDVLGDWSKNETAEVRLFSGTGIYETRFDVSGGRVILDLGTVRDQATVYVNGRLAGRLWKAPFRLDVSDYVYEGSNTLRVEVVNSWRNRLVGEERFAEDLQYRSDGTMSMSSLPEWVRNPDVKRTGERKTFVTHRHVKQGDALSPSGLIGPVRIEQFVP